MNYAIDDAGAKSTGSAIAGMEPEATAKVNQVLQGYLDCKGHSTGAAELSAAFGSFHDRYKTSHVRFPAEVTRLGKNTVEGTNTVVDGENVSTGIHKKVATTGQTLVIDVDSKPKDSNK